VKTKDTFNNTLRTQRHSTNGFIEKKLIPPWDQRERSNRITQGWSPINNVDE
jgi:hypothetical protein